jgi:hypothetical protein
MTHLTTNEVTSTAWAAEIRDLSIAEAAAAAGIEVDLEDFILCADRNVWYLVERDEEDGYHEVVARGYLDHDNRLVAF